MQSLVWLARKQNTEIRLGEGCSWNLQLKEFVLNEGLPTFLQPNRKLPDNLAKGVIPWTSVSLLVNYWESSFLAGRGSERDTETDRPERECQDKCVRIMFICLGTVFRVNSRNIAPCWYFLWSDGWAEDYKHCWVLVCFIIQFLWSFKS